MNNFDSYNETRFRQEMSLMKEAIEAYKRKVQKPHVVEELVSKCRERIFNAATYLGEFDEAHDYADTFEQKRLITRLINSLLRREDEACKCRPDTLPGQGVRLEIPLCYLWRRMRNPKTGEWVDVYKCSKCSFMTTHPTSVITQTARDLERIRSKKGAITKDIEALRR